MKARNKPITIDDALRTIPGFRLPREKYVEHVPNFYCTDYSGAKRNFKCLQQCDACKRTVTERQEQTNQL